MVGTFLLALFVFVIKAALINFYAFRRVPAALRTQMEQSQATAGIALSIVFFFFFLVPGIYLIYSGWRRPQTLRLPVVILGLVLLGSVLAPPRAKPSERACAGPGVLFYLTGDTWTRGAGIWEKGDAGSTLVAQLGGMASDSACFPVAPGKHVFVIGGDPEQPGADKVEVMVEPGKTRRVRIEVRATGATRQGLRTVIGYYTMRVTVEP